MANIKIDNLLTSESHLKDLSQEELELRGNGAWCSIVRFFYNLLC